MKKQKTKLDELILVGLTARTNNTDEMEPDKSKIASLAAFYWGNQVADNFKHRTNPGVTYAVYTEYESDENGEYTYFIGEVVATTEDQDLVKFKTLTIPANHYQKFTTKPGKMPDSVIATWQQIWQMNKQQLGGKRNYLADFEVYDDRAKDPNNTVIDIYISIK
jgi:predicted transcriptional regulator YdeE